MERAQAPEGAGLECFLPYTTAVFLRPKEEWRAEQRPGVCSPLCQGTEIRRGPRCPAQLCRQHLLLFHTPQGRQATGFSSPFKFFRGNAHIHFLLVTGDLTTLNKRCSRVERSMLGQPHPHTQGTSTPVSMRTGYVLTDSYEPENPYLFYHIGPHLKIKKYLPNQIILEFLSLNIYLSSFILRTLGI